MDIYMHPVYICACIIGRFTNRHTCTTCVCGRVCVCECVYAYIYIYIFLMSESNEAISLLSAYEETKTKRKFETNKKIIYIQKQKEKHENRSQRLFFSKTRKEMQNSCER